MTRKLERLFCGPDSLLPRFDATDGQQEQRPTRQCCDVTELSRVAGKLVDHAQRRSGVVMHTTRKSLSESVVKVDPRLHRPANADESVPEALVLDVVRTNTQQLPAPESP